MFSKRVIIIGGGFSGTLTALQLLRQAGQLALEIVVVEAREFVGPGLAYSVPSDRCKLNVPANAMGAFPEMPEGFFEWLKERQPDVRGDSFISRGVYGLYLRDLLSQALNKVAESKLTLVRDEVLDLQYDHERNCFSVSLATNKMLDCDLCVLALGNLERATLQGIKIADVFSCPYSTETYNLIETKNDILIIGTSLTAVDAVLEAEGRGFKGRYTLLSRHGRLPKYHEAPPSGPVELDPRLVVAEKVCKLTLAELVRLVGQESRRIGSSQPVITQMRPYLQMIWSGLTIVERSRFLRHVRSLWEPHRHRIPKPHFDQLQELREQGRLALLSGSIISAKRDSAGVLIKLRHKLGEVARSFDAAIVCAGPEGDIVKAPSQLVQNLVRRKMLISSSLKLGAVVNTNALPASAANRLKLIGPLQRDDLWEITAVRELRLEAHKLAKEILATCEKLPTINPS